MTFSYFVTAMLLVLPGHPARALSQTPWAASSGQRFMVSYPATWKHIDDEFAARLDVINQRSGAEGLLLKPGLAELIVSEDSGSKARSLLEAVTGGSHDATVVARSVLTPRRLSPKSCARLQEIVLDQPLVPLKGTLDPVPIVRTVALLCERDGLRIVAKMRSFRSDRNWDEYRRIVLRVANSIRITAQ